MAAQAQSTARKRTVHQLDTPYSTAQWPEISSEDQDALLELLCSLLSPIGHHRHNHIKPSKGKKAAKERKSAYETSPPPPPDLVHHVHIGLNAITKNLEVKSEDDAAAQPEKSYAVVFVARGDQSSAFNCHFPQMVGAASKDLPAEESIRLVGFSKSCTERLSQCLDIPRVSSVGICRNAPGAKGLLDMVAEVVRPIEVPWLGGSCQPEYLTTKINAIETTVGEKRQRAQ